MAELVRLEVADGVGTIRLDRPPVNALNEQLRVQLEQIVREATARTDVRAIVLYGGEKSFAGGADIKEMAERSYPEMTVFGAALSQTFAFLAAIPKPTVAAITGYALGGGLELALAADRRIAGDNVRVGQPEIQLGVIPGAGGTQRLTRLIGVSAAKELIFTGRSVKADEALRLGIVDEVVAPAEVYNRAYSWAAQFAAGPAVALKAAKEAIDTGLNTDLTSGLKLESQLFAALWATEDQANGMRSFMEHGPGKATFTGK